MVLNNDEKYELIMKAMPEYTYQWMPENYDDPTEPILKVTKSSLGSFNWCAKKYDFSYRERLPQDQTEAMKKGTICHNAREDFFNNFDVKKAENLSPDEIYEYCQGLHPIDDYLDIYINMATFEAQRFVECRDEGKIDEFLPVTNEGKFDANITIEKDINPKFPLTRDYKIHIQGIIDRIFIENGGLIPFEFKTGLWKDYKASTMRKEMAFYQLLIENSDREVLIKNGINPDSPVTHWGWYYPVSNYVFVEKVKARTPKAVIKDIAKLIWSYENNRFPTKFFYKTCASCSYFGICDAAQEDTWL